MLTLRRIEIRRFACFDHLVIEPSADPQRPLTIVRAENGSGKTTFLRAVRWGMYGEKGLPGDRHRFSLHPAWWQPDEQGIESSVVIEFETDGSSRNFSPTESTTTYYQLSRSTRTIAKPATGDNEPDFRRVSPRTRLMVRDHAGNWHQDSTAPEAVIDELLPWALRDFFVMDTDEVADFVGGAENRVISPREVEAKTTSAVRSLLGLEIFDSARDRLADIAQTFSVQATKAIGDQTLLELQDELDHKRAEQEQVDQAIRQHDSRKSDLEHQLAQLEEERDRELQSIGSHDELMARARRVRKQTDFVARERRRFLALLTGDLESVDLLAPLAAVAIQATFTLLKPQYDHGYIPLKHLHFVRDLLDSGTCICGHDISRDLERRTHVERTLAVSSDGEHRANYLYQIYDAADSLRSSLNNSTWDEVRIEHETGVLECDRELRDLDLEKKDIDAKLARIDSAKIQLLRDDIAAVQRQLDTCKSSLARERLRKPDIDAEVLGLRRQIEQRQRNERAAADHRRSAEIGHLAHEILDRAYVTIERSQVRELSARMNKLFLHIAANVSDDDLANQEASKATLRMISDVGVRQVPTRSDKFEIFARNSRGRVMPPIEINGASRRVLALSFVLALCIESQTHAPLIADSLLNFMSGAVRRNTLRVTTQHSRQPILLLTGSDLEAATERDIVAERAGATYTLTGQWDAIDADAGIGGDVVNWSDQRQVALLCTCGPRQFCNICERTGQRGAPGWTPRND